LIVCANLIVLGWASAAWAQTVSLEDLRTSFRAEIDADGDGRVTLSEFSRFNAKYFDFTPDQSFSDFPDADTDGDRQLTGAEIDDEVDLAAGVVFTSCDENEDNALSIAEQECLSW